MVPMVSALERFHCIWRESCIHARKAILVRLARHKISATCDYLCHLTARGRNVIVAKSDFIWVGYSQDPWSVSSDPCRWRCPWRFPRRRGWARCFYHIHLNDHDLPHDDLCHLPARRRNVIVAKSEFTCSRCMCGQESYLNAVDSLYLKLVRDQRLCSR